jgi:hypothetical protein
MTVTLASRSLHRGKRLWAPSIAIDAHPALSAEGGLIQSQNRSALVETPWI